MGCGACAGRLFNRAGVAVGNVRMYADSGTYGRVMLMLSSVVACLALPFLVNSTTVQQATARRKLIRDTAHCRRDNTASSNRLPDHIPHNSTCLNRRGKACFARYQPTFSP